MEIDRIRRSFVIARRPLFRRDHSIIERDGSGSTAPLVMMTLKSNALFAVAGSTNSYCAPTTCVAVVGDQVVEKEFASVARCARGRLLVLGDVYAAGSDFEWFIYNIIAELADVL